MSSGVKVTKIIYYFIDFGQKMCYTGIATQLNIMPTNRECFFTLVKMHSPLCVPCWKVKELRRGIGAMRF